MKKTDICNKKYLKLFRVELNLGVEEIEMALCTIVQGVTGQLPHNLTCDLIKQGCAPAPTFAAFFPALIDQLEAGVPISLK